MKTRLKMVLGTAVLGLVAQGCGSKEKDASNDDKPKEVAKATVDVTAPKAEIAAPVKKELPAPTEFYEGKARVINFAMKDGKPVAVDVWAAQSFKYAPVKLAENVAFGEASEWFQSPKNSPVKTVIAGAPHDSKEDLGGPFPPKKGEHITAMIFNKEDGSFTNGNYWETSNDLEKANTPDAPPAGKGYVVLRAGQLSAHKEALTELTGGWALRVGDGKEKCMTQRVEAMGFQASLLGGTQQIEIDLAPGTHTLTFHKGLEKGCTSATKVYELSLDVAADTAQNVVLYTPDAKTLKHAAFSMPVNTAKPFGTNKTLKEAKDAERAAKKAAKEAATEASP